MCGVIGEIRRTGVVDGDAFGSALDTLRHRGPDGKGIETFLESRAALGHRRLSIIDLSPAGRQPMSNEDESVWLTVNGEIYNHERLRDELTKCGHHFRSRSDSEVLVHGFEEWGIEGLLDRVKGMFAFALLDLKSRKLFAARDRFGMKPLYYAHTEDLFLFASELKAIVANPELSRTVDARAIADYLIYRFIPAPNTIYNEVEKLRPAEFLTFDIDTWDLGKQEYWRLDCGEQHLDTESLRIRTEEYLNNAVKEHLVSDVPVGVLLSGGYDSTTLVHAAVAAGYDPRTYTLGFQNWRNSEHHAAREVAEIYGTQHTERLLSDDFVDEGERLSYYFDEPLGGSSFLPTYQVCQLAAQDVKVVLGGDGGDEVFAGYRWYQEATRKAERRRRSVGRFIRSSEDRLLVEYANAMAWSDFYRSDVKHLVAGDAVRSEGDKYLWLYNRHSVKTTPVKRLQYLDFQTFLPEVVLTKVDRASMANSLEVRVPFLDHELVSLVMSLSEECYYRAGTQKYLLRQILAKHVPDKVLDRPKQGFGAPIQTAFSLDHAKRLLLGGQIVRQEVVSKRMLGRYLSSNAKQKLWALYILEMWLRRWAPV